MERIFGDNVLLSLMHSRNTAVTPLSHSPGTKAPSPVPVCWVAVAFSWLVAETDGEWPRQPGRERHHQALMVLLTLTKWDEHSGKNIRFWGCLWRREELGLDLAGGHTSTACSPGIAGWGFLLLNPRYQMLYAWDQSQLTNRIFISCNFWMVNWNCVAMMLSCGF